MGSFPGAAVTNDHKPGGFKQQKCIFLASGCSGDQKSETEVLAGRCSLQRL